MRGIRAVVGQNGVFPLWFDMEEGGRRGAPHPGEVIPLNIAALPYVIQAKDNAKGITRFFFLLLVSSIIFHKTLHKFPLRL